MKKTKNSVLKEIKQSGAEKVKLAITDIDGILRGKIVHKEKFLTAAESSFGFCDVVFGWDSSDVAYDNTTFTGWHTGYPDARAVIDLNTYRQVPWDGHTPFFLADFRDAEGKDLYVCPRSLLKKIIKQAESLGYEASFSQEFEWFNFRENPDIMHERGFRNPHPLTPGMFGYSIIRASENHDFFNDLFDSLLHFDVPLEGLHTETGPGVYEAAILYSDILEAADRASLFKTAVKEIAHRHGIIATFMAKWNETLPGCSGHVHQSLWGQGKEGQGKGEKGQGNEDRGKGKVNLFHDEKGKYKMSKLMESYMAGQLYCMPHILPMYAPTINSYKRLVEGAWAPTTLTWGLDNRTTALRAIPGNKQSSRLETRVVGSDTNPYLAMAACLASGLYGIKKKMKLDTPETKGNGYRDSGKGKLPATLEHATIAMKLSEVAKELFGEKFVEHFVQTREWECRQYNKAVTDWEMKRYFEII